MTTTQPLSATIRTRDEAYAWLENHDPSAPKRGELAPDFELADVQGLNAVRLSDFRGQRPVALVFGSFT